MTAGQDARGSCATCEQAQRDWDAGRDCGWTCPECFDLTPQALAFREISDALPCHGVLSVEREFLPLQGYVYVIRCFGCGHTPVGSGRTPKEGCEGAMEHAMLVAQLASQNTQEVTCPE